MEVALPILGESAAGFIINKLLTAATSYSKEQYFWKTNLEGEVNDLRNLLPRIKAVVSFAERKTIMNDDALVDWLWQIRDGIDEAEEVLDDLEYIQLEKKANTDITTLPKTVDASIRIAKRALKLDDVPKRLKECVRNLSSIAEGAKNFIELVREADGINNRQDYKHPQFQPMAGERVMNCLPGSKVFMGRENEKQRIIRILMEESESDNSDVLVLPLVGMGGIGKTTLAQQVYKHFETGKHFDIKGWVCISTDFNVISLTKKILESITDNKSEFENPDNLQRKIKENLQSKRYLLVLDDAWNDNELGDWERLCAPLHCGKKGSRILLTTRSNSVVEMVSKVMRGTMEKMNLGGLSDDECRPLLYQYAFVNEDPDAHPQLRDMGEKIVVKLQGLPLLAKTIGGVLNSKLDLQHWSGVLENEVWRTPQNSKDDFIPALRLSYDMLSPLLKRCFAYCSLFPQDYRFEKKELVNMWVAVGLIQHQQSEGLEEDIAGQCLDMLHRKSLFDGYPDSPYVYTMHDMLHGLACHISRHECCRIMHNQPKDIPHNVRHLSITYSIYGELSEKTKKVGELRHLRSLFIDCDGKSQKLYDFIQEVCTSLRSIRVLVIEFHGDSTFDKRWLTSISNLVNLRLLVLPFFIPSKLPESFCRLYFLQILDIGFYARREFPNGMNKLINLKHLYTENSTIFKISKLTCLQELYSYQVGTKNGYMIDELKDMNDLRYLEIVDLHNVQSSEEAKKANLHMKKKLSTLNLSWQEDRHYNPSSIGDLTIDLEHQVLAALNPPCSITKLTITYYSGGKSTPWMNTSCLCHLQSLEISSCPGWEELPPLWDLAHLKHLELAHMNAVRRFCPKFSNSYGVDKPLFQSLETLMVSSLPHLQEWDDADNYIWFPRLLDLQINDCLELRKIPCLPPSLKTFCIEKVGLASLPRSYMTYNDSRTLGGFGELMSLDVLRILGCPEILYKDSIEEDGNFLPSSLTQLHIRDIHGDGLCDYLQGLTKLDMLSLEFCRGMANLPCADHLTTLRRLNLINCGDLVSLGGLHFITSLTKLKIDNCPRLFENMGDTHCNANNFLPASLIDLKLVKCNVCHESLSQSLRGLTSLQKLKLLCCPKILSLPKAEFLSHLTALESLELDGCEELQEVESLRALASLRFLTIFGCPKLVDAASLTQQSSGDKQRETKKERGMLHLLERIEVDNILYLHIFPTPKGKLSIAVLKPFGKADLPNLIPDEVEQWLFGCRESLQSLFLADMPYLETLPSRLESLSALEHLTILGAHQLKSIPRMPASLLSLQIRGCNQRLKKRCREKVGADWPNIKHIRDIEINAYKRHHNQVMGGLKRLYKTTCFADASAA